METGVPQGGTMPHGRPKRDCTPIFSHGHTITTYIIDCKHATKDSGRGRRRRRSDKCRNYEERKSVRRKGIKIEKRQKMKDELFYVCSAVNSGNKMWTNGKRQHNSFLFSSISFLYQVVLLLLVFQTTTAQDTRCFLLQGGSVQNFFVSESLPVGSVLGTLNIMGDPSENGDIYLRLSDPSAPVQISPHSKDILLTEKLDKEGKTGPSHVVVNVICQKRKTNDVDIQIPINIRVTDSNDNSPIFINAPYYVNVSEATVLGTVIVGEILATDADQKGPFSTVQYSVKEGPHSTQFAFESPISGALQLRKNLDYEMDPLFNITIVAEDQGSPPRRSESFVTVQVLDSDDQNPAFTRHRYMAFLPEQPLQGTVLEVQPERIWALDQDMGIRAPIVYSLARDVVQAFWFSIDSDSGEVMLSKDVQDDSLMQPIALSVVATQRDNPDRVASSILTVSRRGASSPQLQFLQRFYEATVLENLVKDSLIAQTLTNRTPLQNVHFGLESDGLGVFYITKTGQVLLSQKLDYERRNVYNLKIYVSDGEYNDTAHLRVNVLNVNDWDPRFQYPQYEFYVKQEHVQAGDVVGNVTVADGDNDHIALSVRGRNARMFDISSGGEILIRRVQDLNSTQAHIVLVAKDTGEPPRQSSVPVTIHFPKGFVKSFHLTSSSSFLLMVVFGSLLGVFLLVILCLALYIHKNKKYRDDSDAALPTKMSKILTSNSAAASKMDPLTSVTQANGRSSGLTGIDTSKMNGNKFNNNNNNNSISENEARTPFNTGSLRGSTTSVKSGADSPEGSRRYLRNPLANGGPLGGVYGEVDVEGGSLNGTDSTATVGNDSPKEISSRSSTPNAVTRIFGKPSSVAPSTSNDGTARATGGLPPSARVVPTPPVAPPFFFPSRGNKDNSASPDPPPMVSPNKGSLSGRRILSSNGTLPPSKGRVLWPSSALPKKVKKLSWEDELCSQTEMDPEVSVTPMPHAKGGSSDSPNLTVYF